MYSMGQDFSSAKDLVLSGPLSSCIFSHDLQLEVSYHHPDGHHHSSLQVVDAFSPFSAMGYLGVFPPLLMACLALVCPMRLADPFWVFLGIEHRAGYHRAVALHSSVGLNVPMSPLSSLPSFELPSAGCFESRPPFPNWLSSHNSILGRCVAAASIPHQYIA